MVKFRIIILAATLFWTFEVKAQVPEEFATPDQWQLTLDVIKAKAQRLVVKNNGLLLEHKGLTEQVQELQRAIDAEQSRIDQWSKFLKQRHGRTDQQLLIEQYLQTMKAKKEQSRDLDGQWRALSRRQGTGDDLSQWRRQLEYENSQEALLQDELKELKAGNTRQANARRYEELNMRKEKLEASINDYVSRMDELKRSSLLAVSWPAQRKQMVHAMVETDASNNHLRDKIGVLRQDVKVLKEEVAALERQLNTTRR